MYLCSQRELGWHLSQPGMKREHNKGSVLAAMTQSLLTSSHSDRVAKGRRASTLDNISAHDHKMRRRTYSLPSRGTIREPLAFGKQEQSQCSKKCIDSNGCGKTIPTLTKAP